MATFLLVHGGWHGGWCWSETDRALRSLGHEVHAPTLTGLGERSHLAHPAINADLHVQDICNIIRWRELSDIVLVGHSYGGIIITGVADRMPEEIGALVYLDALVPRASDAVPFSDGSSHASQLQARLAGGFLVPPDTFEDFEDFVDDPVRMARVKALCTPHPVGCFIKGVTLTGAENRIRNRLYILATRYKPSRFWKEYEIAQKSDDWDVETIDTKHDAMIDQPEELARLLHRYAHKLLKKI